MIRVTMQMAYLAQSQPQERHRTALHTPRWPKTVHLRRVIPACSTELTNKQNRSAFARRCLLCPVPDSLFTIVVAAWVGGCNMFAHLCGCSGGCALSVHETDRGCKVHTPPKGTPVPLDFRQSKFRKPQEDAGGTASKQRTCTPNLGASTAEALTVTMPQASNAEERAQRPGEMNQLQIDLSGMIWALSRPVADDTNPLARHQQAIREMLPSRHDKPQFEVLLVVKHRDRLAKVLAKSRNLLHKVRSPAPKYYEVLPRAVRQSHRVRVSDRVWPTGHCTTFAGAHGQGEVWHIAMGLCGQGTSSHGTVGDKLAGD